MDSELVQMGRKALISSDQTTKKVVGGSLVKVGGTGVGLMVAATVLPFVGVFGLVMLLLVIGGYMWFTG